ncbi:MAG: hypothetical protein QM528_02810 [Phycisphaerales bacterium]|nr:hypothetical protein [Phycisphaerales bacterium]
MKHFLFLLSFLFLISSSCKKVDNSSVTKNDLTITVSQQSDRILFAFNPDTINIALSGTKSSPFDYYFPMSFTTSDSLQMIQPDGTLSPKSLSFTYSNYGNMKFVFTPKQDNTNLTFTITDRFDKNKATQYFTVSTLTNEVQLSIDNLSRTIGTSQNDTIPVTIATENTQEIFTLYSDSVLSYKKGNNTQKGKIISLSGAGTYQLVYTPSSSGNFTNNVYVTSQYQIKSNTVTYTTAVTNRALYTNFEVDQISKKLLFANTPIKLDLKITQQSSPVSSFSFTANDSITYDGVLYLEGSTITVPLNAVVGSTTIPLYYRTYRSNQTFNMIIAYNGGTAADTAPIPLAKSYATVVGDNGLYSTTTDGGITWSPAQTIMGMSDINAVAFSSATNGVAVGDNGLYSTTTDGGQTWAPAQTISGMSSIYSVVFSSATNGVAVGYNGLYSTTTDGGRTWSPAQTIQGFEFIRSVAFSSATNGVAVGSEHTGKLNFVGQYSTTTDGGITWAPAQTISGFSNINTVTFSSATNGVAGGNDRQYSTTTDGGRTWSPAQTISGFYDININAVTFSSSTNGVAVGQNSSPQAVYSYTTNGGITWSTAQTISGFNNINAVTFSSSTNGVAVGYGGLYSYTTDGGQTWSNTQTISGMSNILSIAFSN